MTSVWTEDQFLEQLAAPQLDVKRLFEELERLAGAGAIGQADTLASLLEETLAARGRHEDALAILQRRLEWTGGGGGGRDGVRQRAELLLGSDPERKRLVAYAGFDRDIPPAQAVERLRRLLRLSEGQLVLDRTWGAGIVRRCDPLNGRVMIDFEQRPGHEMSYAYAAEALQSLPPDHLLARYLTDRDAVVGLAQRDPAGLVVWALRDFGPLTVDQLRERLSPRIVPEADWKSFWDSARKGLKAHPEVRMPARRTDPLRWVSGEERYGQGWLAELRTERDLDRLAEMLEELVEARPQLPESARPVVEDRLTFLARGASGGRRPDLLARARMCAARWALLLPALEHPPADDPWDRTRWPQAFRALRTRRLRDYLEYLDARDAERTRQGLLELLESLDLSSLGVVLEFLMERGLETDCAERFRRWMARQEIGVEPLAWLFRNPEFIRRWQVARLSDLGRRALDLAEETCGGDRLKAQKVLKDRFGHPEMLRDILADMSESQRRDFIARLRKSPGWPPLDRQAILGLLVRLCPEYEPLVAGEPAGAARQPAQVLRSLTSLRTYRERQEQLRRLIEVEIPKNSREIAHARSYGDLRENFEYKAAKDMQALLLRRRAELEQQLREVQPTDFAHAPLDRVGPGVGVELRFPDGRVERYHVLGAWDRDEALRIISSESSLARAMAGRAVGDEVQVPGEEAGTAVIERIFALPDEVRAWARGDAESAET